MPDGSALYGKSLVQVHDRATVKLPPNGRMAAETPTTMQKAFAFNMDHDKYGTIAEIGAGQEVSRCFFRAA